MDDKSRDKLNKSNGGGGGNLGPGCIAMKAYCFCQFLLVFMTSMHTDTDYTRKTCFSFLVFVILGADSQIFV